MSSINHKYNSSMVHMFASQKLMGSILSQAELSFCCPVRIYTSFHTEVPREDTSSKHERYTRNGANRILSLTKV